MPTYRDEAVVLRTQGLGEADRIVTLFGKEHGRIRAVGRGVRRTSSKFGARLEPFTVVDLQCYEGRSLDTVTQAVTLATYGSGIAEDYDAYAAANAMVETVERLVDEGDAAPQQYFLLIGGLRALSRGDHAVRLTLDSYLLRAFALAGWRPALEQCARCEEAGPHPFFSPSLGGALCARHAPPGSARVEPETLRHLAALLAGDWEVAEATDAGEQRRASAVVAAYVQFHLERHLRSLDVLEGERERQWIAAASAVRPSPRPASTTTEDRTT